MKGFVIKANTVEAKKIILKDIKETNIQERATMFSLFKRRIIEDGEKIIIDYKFRKAFRKKFNKNINSSLSSYSVEDIPKEITGKYDQLGLIKDIDFNVEVY